MSYYSQNVYSQPPSSSSGLQFLPTQFSSSTQSSSTSQGMMSGQGTGSYSGYGEGVREPLSTGILAAFGTQGYSDEPPLLEELGFNFSHIKQKTLTVLNPFQEIEQNIMDDSDLAGPILFCLLFGTFLLLSGKIHFGYIYGAALIGTLSLYAILNLMSLTKSIDFIRVASVLGYCLLPLVANSSLAVFLSMDGSSCHERDSLINKPVNENASFILPMEKREYIEQYSNFYLQRLNGLRRKVYDVAHKSWCDMIIEGSTVYHSERVLDLAFLMRFHRRISAPLRPPPKYTDATNDETYLEDESGRVRLVGSLIENSLLVTGCVAAILGRELPSGDFEVLDIRFTEYAPQQPIPEVSYKKAQYVAIISGLSIDNSANNENYLQPLVEFFNGELGGDEDRKLSSNIVHLIIAGNSLNTKTDVDSNISDEQSASEIPKIPLKKINDFSRIASDPLKRLDQLIKDIAFCIPTSIMPGEFDFSNLTLPQQPLHKAFFHLSRELKPFNSFFNITNPSYWSFNGITLLGDSGQPINDMYKYLHEYDIDRLDLMNQCLRWQTIAPTAPDTLASYPFIKSDPFLIQSTPHIYFSSNQPYFDTRIVQGLDELGNSVYTRLLTVPEFRKTGQIVLINITSRNFETSTIKLSCD